MMFVLILAAAAAAAVALAVVPFLLPWQQQVRWLVVVNATRDPWSRGGSNDVRMDEVRVVQRTDDIVWLAGAGALHHALRLPDRADADDRWLDGCAFAGTSLLQVVHPDRTISLHAPDRALFGLEEPASVRALADDLEHWLRQTSEAMP